MKYIELLKKLIGDADLWEGSKELKRGEYLKTGGSTDRRMYYVEHGALRIFLMEGKQEQTVRFGYADNFITALDSFIHGGPSELYIQALRTTKVRFISQARFETLIHASPANLSLWNKILSQLLLDVMQREQDILTQQPLQRYKRVLARSPKLFQEIPDKYIADYLNMTPETLSRMKNLDLNQEQLDKKA